MNENQIDSIFDTDNQIIKKSKIELNNQENINLTFHGDQEDNSYIYQMQDQGAINRREYFQSSMVQQKSYKKSISSLSSIQDFKDGFFNSPQSPTQKDVSLIQNMLEKGNTITKEKQTSMQRTSQLISSNNCNIISPSQLTAIEEKKSQNQEQQTNIASEQKSKNTRNIIQKKSFQQESRTSQEIQPINFDSTKYNQKTIFSSLVKKSAYFDKIDLQSSTICHDIHQQYRNENSYKKNYLVIITYMKKFANKLLLKLAYKDNRLLNSTHLSMIRDKAIIDYQNYFNEILKSQKCVFPLKFQDHLLENKKHQILLRNTKTNTQQRNTNIFFLILKIMFGALKQANDIIGVISPNSIIIAIIQAIIVVLIFYFIFILSIQSCFLDYNQEQFYGIQQVYLSGLGYTLIDIYIGFYQGFYEFGCVQNNRLQIAKRYFKNRFYIDLIMLNCYLFNYMYQHNISILLTIIFSVIQVNNKVKQINDYFKLSSRFPFWFDILKLLVTILIIAHICGCGFHYVSQMSLKSHFDQIFKDGNSNWIDFQGLKYSDWKTRYVYSLYFSVITMATVGYGDVFPVNLNERVYVIAMTLVSCGAFAYSINYIGQIFTQIQQESQSFQQKQYDLLNYMRLKHISKETQTRILKYLEYLEDKTDQIATKGQQILEDYPPDLRDEVMKENFLKLLNQAPFLKNTFSQDFLLQLCLKFKEKRIGPGEILVRKNQQLEFLYILTKGIAEYVNFDGIEKLPLYQIKNIQNEQTLIDVRLFFTGIEADVTIQSKIVSCVAFISFEDFYQVVKQFPSDYEVFCMLKDQFLNDSRQYLQCQSCNQIGHSFISCGQLHYDLDNQLFLQRQLKSIPQKRLFTIRNRQNKYNSVLQKLITSQNLKLFRWTLAQKYLHNYNHIDPIMEASVIENEKLFYKRCPKVNFKLFFAKSQTVFQRQNTDNPSTDSQSECSLSSDSFTKSSQSSNRTPTHYTQSLFSEQKLKNPVSELSIKSYENRRNSRRTLTFKKKTTELENQTVTIRDIPINDSQQDNSFATYEVENQQKQLNLESLQKIDTMDRSVDNCTPDIRIQYFQKNNPKKNSQIFEGKQFDDLNSQTNYTLKANSSKNKSDTLKIQTSEIDNKLSEYQQQQDLKNSINSHLQNLLCQNPVYQVLQKLLNDSLQKTRKSFSHTSISYIPQDSMDITKDQIDSLQKFKKRQNLLINNINMQNFKRIPSIATNVIKQDILVNNNKELQKEENHIFGKLEFTFDRIQEYEKYFPKNNWTKVIKSYKKQNGIEKIFQTKNYRKINKAIQKIKIIESNKNLQVIASPSPIQSQFRFINQDSSKSQEGIFLK
ncbi:hypothetical protein ABPG74_006254 [Tetrahymena malaccensis]